MRQPLISNVLNQLSRIALGSGWSSLAVFIGLFAMLAITVEQDDIVAHSLTEATLWVCVTYFAVEWIMRLRQASQPLLYVKSLRGLIDAASVLAVPLALIAGLTAKSAWSFGVIWLLKP